jgi:phthalate 4,5-dioxygenase oxygenase subunit
MLSQEENLRLCRAGPGTPMGEALRRYWIPMCPSKDVASPDDPPRAVMRLGERFVVFRDTSGQVGVLEEQCCHRGASLRFGQVEQGGIRCLYHGWKFAVDGTILETPNLPDSRVRERLKAPAFPVHEAGEVIFAYLGPRDKMPPRPRYSWMEGPPEHRFVFEHVQENCNWVQALEGGLDSSHVGILHKDEMALATIGLYDPDNVGKDRYPSKDQAPRLEVEDSPYGFVYAAIRKAIEPGKRYVRITPYVLPFMTFPAMRSCVMRLPVDDTSTAVISVVYNAEVPPEPLAQLERQGMATQATYGPDRILRIPPQDRASMAEGRSFSGFAGFNIQDGAMTMFMGGPILDRTKEHLVPADYAIVRMRRLLLDVAQQVEAGEDPLGTSPQVDLRAVAGTSGLIGEGERWQDLLGGSR